MKSFNNVNSSYILYLYLLGFIFIVNYVKCSEDDNEFNDNLLDVNNYILVNNMDSENIDSKQINTDIKGSGPKDSGNSSRNISYVDSFNSKSINASVNTLIKEKENFIKSKLENFLKKYNLDIKEKRKKTFFEKQENYENNFKQDLNLIPNIDNVNEELMPDKMASNMNSHISNQLSAEDKNNYIKKKYLAKGDEDNDNFENLLFDLKNKILNNTKDDVKIIEQNKISERFNSINQYVDGLKIKHERFNFSVNKSGIENLIENRLSTQCNNSTVIVNATIPFTILLDENSEHDVNKIKYNNTRNNYDKDIQRNDYDTELTNGDKQREFKLKTNIQTQEQNINLINPLNARINNILPSKKSNIEDPILDRYLDSKLDFQIFKDDKIINHFENLSSEINFSQDALHVIFSGISIDKEEKIKSYLSDFSTITDGDSLKLSFDYRSIENCENLIINKQNMDNYKPKDLNSFNNMFLNNQDNEDVDNNISNPNYEEKNFENEYYMLNNFNFYLKFNLRFEQNLAKRRDIRKLLDPERQKSVRNEKENNFEFESTGKNSQFTINLVIRLNFNHRNSNGKTFLKYFENLNNRISQNGIFASYDRRNNKKNGKEAISSSSFSFLAEEEDGIAFSLDESLNKFYENLKITDKEKTEGENKKNKMILSKESKRQIIEDPLDKDQYYNKNLENKYSDITIKEKKMFFLKFLNSILYDSCKVKKLQAQKLKQRLKKTLEEDYIIFQNITKLEQKINGLNKLNETYFNLYNESRSLMKEKNSIQNIEIKQIDHYKKLIEKSEKALIRDYLLIKKDDKRLSLKLNILENFKNLYNQSKRLESEKLSVKEEYEYNIDSFNNKIIKLQSDLLDNENLLTMVASDRQILDNKIQYKLNRIKRNDHSIAILNRKLISLVAEKNRTVLNIKDNHQKQENIISQIAANKNKVLEIDKKIQALLEQKNFVVKEINEKNDSLEKLETENLTHKNKLVLLNTNMDYLKENLDEKIKEKHNTYKNLNITKYESEKNKLKSKFYITQIKEVNNTIANLTNYIQSYSEKINALNKDISEHSIQQTSLTKKIIEVLDDINSLQVNINRYNANIKNNKINKKNFQINIKNIIDDLVKKKVFSNDIKLYQYYDNLEPSKNFGKDDNIHHLQNIKRDTRNSNFFNMDEYKDFKQKKFNDFLLKERREKNKAKDKIKITSLDINNEDSLYSDQYVLSNSSKDFNSEIYSEIDLTLPINEQSVIELLDDYIVFDYYSLNENLGILVNKKLI